MPAGLTATRSLDPVAERSVRIGLTSGDSSAASPALVQLGLVICGDCVGHRRECQQMTKNEPCARRKLT